MAVLERIRSKFGILITIIIGLALIAFVLTDLLSNTNSIFSSVDQDVAVINGKEVNIRDFNYMIQESEEAYKFTTGQTTLNEQLSEQIREQAWQELIQKKVIIEECQKVGLDVTSKEIRDLTLGANPHPIVRQLFTGQDGIFKRDNAIQFFNNLDKEGAPEQQKFWNYIEGQIIRDKMMNKYFNLIGKAMYVTNAEVEKGIKDASKKVTFNYVVSRYSDVSDSTIKVKDSDLEDYLDKHQNEYQQEASRDIEYITYEIVPSQADTNQAYKWISDNKQPFIDSKEPKQFVNLNSDIPFDEKYYKQSELADTVKSMYSAKLDAVFGPYFDQTSSSFKIVRLVDVKEMPDSVKASHILLTKGASKEELLARADSLKEAVKKGSNFAVLAAQFSSDGSAQNGGDLGWFKEGMMVKPFNDACFNGKKGDVVVVESQFGIHVIQITDKGKEVKKVQLATLVRRVDASNATRESLYQQASAFAGNNNTGEKFQASLKKKGILPKKASQITENAKEIPGIENSRELVRWAFDAKEDDISGVMDMVNRFVIARLAEVREKGIASIENTIIRRQIEGLVIREKKAEIIIEKLKKEMAGVSNIDNLAVKLNTKVETVADISFNSYSLPFGYEPEVIGAVTSIPANKLSAPVKGKNGIYVVLVTNVAEQPTDAVGVKQGLSANAGRASYQAYNALRKKASIEDRRFKFF